MRRLFYVRVLRDVRMARAAGRTILLCFNHKKVRDLHVLAVGADPDTKVDALREELRHLYRTSAIAVPFDSCLAILLLYVVRDSAPLSVRAGWASLIIAALVARLWRARRWRRRQPNGAESMLREHRRFLVLCALFAVAWGVGSAIFLISLEPYRQGMVLIVLAAVLIGPIATMATTPNAFYVHVLALFGPPLVYLVAADDEHTMELALLLTVLLAAGSAVYFWNSNRLSAAIRLKKEADTLAGTLSEANQTLAVLNEYLQRVSSLDGLTGVANRWQLDETLNREWVRALRSGRPLAYLMVDIDHFKRYNDYYGHTRGDDCLRQVAERLGRVARRPADLVGRYGGEEFALLLPETDVEDAARLAAELLHQFEVDAIPNESSPIAGRVTVSVGVASVVPDPSLGRRDLQTSADAALYRAKAAGRNRVEVAENATAPPSNKVPGDGVVE